jgi:hypothetical protein
MQEQSKQCHPEPIPKNCHPESAAADEGPPGMRQIDLHCRGILAKEPAFS